MAFLLTHFWTSPFFLLALALLMCPLGMISVNGEQILTFAQLAKRLPRRRRDRPASVSTIHRWRTRGVRGVRLEAVRCGGTWVTSLEAYQRFCDALTAAETGITHADKRRDKQTEQRLDDIGI